MIGKILREIMALKDIIEATNDQILIWMQRVNAQRAKKGSPGPYKGRQKV